MQYTINDATNQLFDSDGNIGIFQDGDPVYVAYLAWHEADPENNLLQHVNVPLPGVDMKISKVDFMDRFQEQELYAMYTVAKTNVAIEVFLKKFELAEFVNLDDPRTQAGVMALEQFGLIGAGRAQEILG